MLFYCESYKRNSLLVLDVKNLDDLSQWWRQRKIGKWDPSDKRSLIEIENISCIPYRGPREGAWYNLPDNFWEGFTFNMEKYSLNKINYSLIFRINANSSRKEYDFLNYKVNFGE